MAANDNEICLPVLGFLDNYYFGVSPDHNCLDLQCLRYGIVPEPIGSPCHEITQTSLLFLQKLLTHRTNDMERIRCVRLRQASRIFMGCSFSFGRQNR